MVETNLRTARQFVDAPTPPVTIRSKEQLVSSVNRFIELYTHIYPPRIHKQATLNVQAVEAKSDIVDPLQIKSVEDIAQVIRDASSSNPDAVIDAIYEKPPTVTINNCPYPDKFERQIIKPASDNDDVALPFTEVIPSNEDMELSKKKTFIPSGTNSNTTQELDYLIKACQGFLSAPLTRMDGFGSSPEGHKQRRLYETGIKSAMAYLSEGSGLAPEKNWSASFQRRWDNIKVTKNRQTAVLNNFDVVAKRMLGGQTMTLGIIDTLSPFILERIEDINLARLLREQGKTSVSADILTRISRDVLKHFGSDSHLAKEIGFQRFTYFERDFVTALYSYLYGPNAALTDINTVVNTLNMIFPKKEYMRIMPFLQTLVQYSNLEFKEIERRVSLLNDDVLNPDLEIEAKKSKKEEAIEQSVLHAYELAKAIPAPNGINPRVDIELHQLKGAKIPAVFDDSSGKLVKALSIIALEFYHGKLSQDSLTNRILFKHHTGEKLDFFKTSK